MRGDCMPTKESSGCSLEMDDSPRNPNKPTIHILKTLGTVWDAIERGEKRFEVRRNDRFFQRGDIVTLRKMDETGRYYETGATRFTTLDISFRIGWMLQGGQFGIEPGYVVFQLEPI